MALYLGTEKLCAHTSTTVAIETPALGSNVKTGTVTADDNGVVTFPELDFTPKMITLWNLQLRDLKAEAEENGEDWEDGWVQYIHEGIMLMAVYQDGIWVTQGDGGNSGEVYISNVTYQSGSCISVENNKYSYRISKHSDAPNFPGETFNYAIYG